jgi:hypothetical protein
MRRTCLIRQSVPDLAVSIRKQKQGQKWIVMRTNALFLLFPVIVLVCAATLCGEPAAKLANLGPELQQVLQRDAVCSQKSPAPELPVVTQPIMVSGREAGVIAEPQDQCYCHKENCSTFVYLKKGENYNLALADNFASLRPMKVTMHGLPSLSGKYQVDEFREETTVFDWTGQQYQPSLCATVTRRPNQRTPSIVKHQCKATVRSLPRQ